MPKSSSDQSRYSVDEMMERLRESERSKREEETSELVTRSDGTQVVRKRKRKRRTKQRHKERQVRQRRLLTALGICAGIALLGVIVAGVVLIARFNSKGFRDTLTQRFGTSSGSTAAFSDLTVTPVRVRAESLSMDWEDGGLLKSLRFGKLSADLAPSSLFGKDWSGEEALFETGTMTLGTPERGSTPPALSGSFPFNFQQYRCSQFGIQWSAEQPIPFLHGSEMTLRPDGPQMILLIAGGRLELPGWKGLRVRRGTAFITPDSFNLQALRLQPSNTETTATAMLSSVRATGRGEPVELNMELMDFPLGTLAGPDLGLLIRGSVNTPEGGPGRITIPTEDPRALLVAVRFSGSDAGFPQTFPFLTSLATLFQESDYNKPAFTSVSGTLRHTPDATRMEDLLLHDEEKLKITGEIVVSPSGRLSGELTIHIAEKAFQSPSGQKLWMSAFKEAEGSWRTFEVSLSGSAKGPEDNFNDALRVKVDALRARQDLRERTPGL